MSISGSGVGGNIGGPQQPLPEDIKATAATTAYRQAVGIVSDTLTMSFTKFGETQRWKYDSPANRPTLAPLGSLRINLSAPPPMDDSWKAYFDTLLQKLPPDVFTALTEETGKPFDERNPALTTLNYLLTAIAKGMTWSGLINDQIAMESPTLLGSGLLGRTEQSQKLAERGLQGAIGDGASIYAFISNYLSEKGANEINFDTQLNFNRQMGDAFSALTTLSNELSNPESIEDIQIRQNHLAGALNTLNQAFQASYNEEDLQIFGSTFQALGTLASALANRTGSPSLFIGLELAFHKANPESVQSGLFGDSLRSGLNVLSNGLQALFSAPNRGAQRYFELLVSLSAIAAISLGYLTTKNGIGILPNPQADLTAEQENRIFAFDLAATFLTSSKILPDLFEEAAAACGASEKDQGVIANALSAVFLMLAISGASRGSEKEFNHLIVQLKAPLQTYLDKTSKFVHESLANGTLTGEAAVQLSVGIEQAKISLEKEDFDSFKSAYSNLLTLSGLSLDSMKNILKQVEGFADLAMDAWIIGPDDQTNTLTGVAFTA